MGVPMPFAARLADRARELRLGRERQIQRFRLAALLLSLLQTLVRPGDSPLVGVAALALLAGTSAAVGLALRGSPADAVVRRVGAWSMAADVVGVAVVLANNQTDPAEPVYLVGFLAMAEATVRWPARGGAIAATANAAAAAAWTVSVQRSTGLGDVSHVTLRGGILLVLGLFVAGLVQRLSERGERLQRILDLSHDLIAVLDADGRILSVSSASTVVLGRRPEELIGVGCREIMHPDDVPPTPPGSGLAALDDDGPVLLHRRFLRPDGSVRWLELSVVAAPDGCFHVTGRDVTDRREAQRRVAESEERLRSLFARNPDGVIALDLDGVVLDANAAAAELAGVDVRDLRGDVLGLVDPDDRDACREAFARAVAGAPVTVEVRLPGPAHPEGSGRGSGVEVDLTLLPIVTDDGVVGVYGVASDETERLRLARELAHRASHDPLTGVANRTLLEQALAAEAGSRPPTARAERVLLFVDLDRFKVVNDSLGHRSGDHVLVETVARLARVTRAGDLLARWAGDEFCILLRPGTDEAEAQGVAEAVLEAVAAPIAVAGRLVRLTASVGLASGRPGEGSDGLVQLADQAMYEAKRAGRNRLRVARPAAPAGAPTRLDREIALRRAIEHDELVIHHQPIVEVGTGRITGTEALVRWPLPDGGLRPPADFVPLAEETGLIRPLTRLVLRRACAQLAAWDRAGASPDLEAWVNVSAPDVADPELVVDVAEALRDADVATERLVLEVTESMLVDETDQVDQVVASLARLGVRLVIDDFGTGYSSMAQLHRLRVSGCKIDRVFLEEARQGGRAAAVLSSLVGLGVAFDLQVVGEGVEHAEHLDALASAGCALAQGYLLARPADAASLTPLVLAGAVALPTPTAQPEASASTSSALRMDDRPSRSISRAIS